MNGKSAIFLYNIYLSLKYIEFEVLKTWISVAYIFVLRFFDEDPRLFMEFEEKFDENIDQYMGKIS